MSRQFVSSGSEWEEQVGYSRAVRVGDQVFVSGTTASDENGRPIRPGDFEAQTRGAIAKIVAALEEAGAEARHVVRTRVFTTDITKWGEIGRAHAAAFGETRPAMTLVEVRRLIDPDHLVEIEADAVIPKASE